MKSYSKSQLVAVLAIAVMGCGCTTGGTKQTAGTLLGGVGGGVLGSTIGKGKGKTAATIAGALIGGYIGGTIGKGLDDTDRMMANRTAQQTFEHTPDGQASAWSNPNSGNSGSMIVNNTYTPPQGTPCREYTTTVMVGGKREQAYGKACRQADGSWKIMSEGTA